MHLLRILPCLFLPAALFMSGSAKAQQWKAVSEANGIRLESRPIAGERYDELRASTLLSAPPEAIADYLFGKYLDERNKNIRRTFIQRGTELTVWSDVVSMSVFGDRCYSIRFERQRLVDGAIRVKFASLDYVGQKPTAGCIALRARGEWIMTPTHDGTRLTYASLTDIGGDVPAFLARRSLASAAILSIRKVVAGSSGLALPRGMGD